MIIKVEPGKWFVWFLALVGGWHIFVMLWQRFWLFYWLGI